MNEFYILDNCVIAAGPFRHRSFNRLRNKPTNDGVVCYHDPFIVPVECVKIDRIDTSQKSMLQRLLPFCPNLTEMSGTSCFHPYGIPHTSTR